MTCKVCRPTINFQMILFIFSKKTYAALAKSISYPLFSCDKHRIQCIFFFLASLKVIGDEGSHLNAVTVMEAPGADIIEKWQDKPAHVYELTRTPTSWRHLSQFLSILSNASKILVFTLFSIQWINGIVRTSQWAFEVRRTFPERLLTSANFRAWRLRSIRRTLFSTCNTGDQRTLT